VLVRERSARRVENMVSESEQEATAVRDNLLSKKPRVKRWCKHKGRRDGTPSRTMER
jgi:hypothetical protein